MRENVGKIHEKYGFWVVVMVNRYNYTTSMLTSSKLNRFKQGETYICDK